MSIENVRDAVTRAAGGAFVCDSATMTCLEGGRRELFQIYLKDGRKIELIVPGGTQPEEIGRLALDKTNKP